MFTKVGPASNGGNAMDERRLYPQSAIKPEREKEIERDGTRTDDFLSRG